MCFAKNSVLSMRTLARVWFLPPWLFRDTNTQAIDYITLGETQGIRILQERPLSQSWYIREHRQTASRCFSGPPEGLSWH